MNSDPRSVGDLASIYAAHIKGKIVLVTGVSPGGMGAAFATGIANARPSLLVLAGRNLSKVQETARAISADHSDIHIRMLELDLASLAAVRAAADTVNGWDDVS